MSLNVRRVRLVEIRLPLREPFRISSGVVEERRILLVELEDASGATAWSECVAFDVPNYSPDTIDTSWLILERFLAPRLVGHAFAHPSDVSPHLERDFRGHLMAKAALEMGMWGLEATRRGVALAVLLEGTREHIATGISLGIQESPKVLVERVEKELRAGYLKIKIKIKPGADEEYLRAVRDALGDDAPLMADANSAYTLADTEHLRRLDDLDLMMIEQPLAWDDLLRHAELQKHLETPVCLDESITGLDRAEDMLTLGAGRIVNLKPGRVGGLGPSLAIHDLCLRRHVPLWCGGMLETGIGRAYNVALASLPGFTLPGDVSPSARYWRRDIVDPEWTMEDGLVTVPRDRSGLGVEVDVERIESLTVRETTIGEGSGQ